jgi:hypothetical protein
MSSNINTNTNTNSVNQIVKDHKFKAVSSIKKMPIDRKPYKRKVKIIEKKSIIDVLNTITRSEKSKIKKEALEVAVRKTDVEVDKFVQNLKNMKMTNYQIEKEIKYSTFRSIYFDHYYKCHIEYLMNKIINPINSNYMHRCYINDQINVNGDISELDERNFLSSFYDIVNEFEIEILNESLISESIKYYNQQLNGLPESDIPLDAFSNISQPSIKINILPFGIVSDTLEYQQLMEVDLDGIDFEKLQTIYNELNTNTNTKNSNDIFINLESEEVNIFKNPEEVIKHLKIDQFLPLCSESKCCVFCCKHTKCIF